MTTLHPPPEIARNRSCEGKRRYWTRWGANSVVLRIARQERDETIQSYKCQFCGFWHVGHRKEPWQR